MIKLKAHLKRLVIIGLGTGGLHSIRSTQKTDRSIDITVIEKRSYDMFSPCGLPYAIGKQVESFDALKYTIPSTRRLHKLLQHEAKKINLQEKTVTVQDLRNDETFDLPFDRLIISTGSNPRVLDIPGAYRLLGKGVHVVSDPENARRLQEDAMKSKTAVIVGGGGIGLEIASALTGLGLQVFITKRSLPPFPRSLDPDMGEIIKDFLLEHGCKVLFGRGIYTVNGDEKVESVTIGDETIPTEIVVMAVGVEPEVSLAEEAGLKLVNGAIETNERMETSEPDVYAVGECALTFSGIDKTPIKIDLATTAYKQAVVGGANAAGADKKFPGAFGTFVSYIGDLEVASTGFNTEIAMDHGFTVVSGRARLRIKPKYMPGSKEMSVRVIVDEATGRIIGGQAIGAEGAAWRINMLSLAIMKRITIEEFSKTELAYCPAISELYDPLQAAVDVALQRLNKRKR